MGGGRMIIKKKKLTESGTWEDSNVKKKQQQQQQQQHQGAKLVTESILLIGFSLHSREAMHLISNSIDGDWVTRRRKLTHLEQNIESQTVRQI